MKKPRRKITMAKLRLLAPVVQGSLALTDRDQRLLYDVPTNRDATEARARAEAAVMLAHGHVKVWIMRSRFQEQGRTHFRYYCLDAMTVAFFGHRLHGDIIQIMGAPGGENTEKGRVQTQNRSRGQGRG